MVADHLRTGFGWLWKGFSCENAGRPSAKFLTVMPQNSVLRRLARNAETKWAPTGNVGSPRVQILALTALATAGFVGILLATTYGVGLEPDSQAYIAGARSLAQGHGYSYPTAGGGFRPIVVWPPVYSFVLSLPGFLGFDPMGFARTLAAIVLASNVFLVGWLIRQEPGASFWPPLIGAILILTSTDMLSMHIRVLSEPLFITTVLLGMLCTQRAIIEGSRPLGYLAALILGISTITRFAGLAFVGSGTIRVVLRLGGSWRKRITESAVFFAVAIAPFLVWVTRNRLLAESMTGRETGWHPLGTLRWGTLGNALSCWLVPETSPNWLRFVGLAIVLLGLAVTVAMLIGTPRALEKPPAFARQLIFAAACYLALLVFVMTFIDPRLAFERRVMAPLYPVLTIAVLTTLPHLQVPRGRLRRVALVVLSLSTLAWFGARAGLWFKVASSDAQGLAGRRFKESETLALAKGYFPRAECLYANNVPAVYFHLGRAAFPVPRIWDADRARANVGFVDETRIMRGRLADRGGIVIWLYDLPGRGDAKELEDLQAAAPMVALVRAPDGVLLGPQRNVPPT